MEPKNCKYYYGDNGITQIEGHLPLVNDRDWTSGSYVPKDWHVENTGEISRTGAPIYAAHERKGRK